MLLIVCKLLIYKDFLFMFVFVYITLAFFSFLMYFNCLRVVRFVV